MKNFVLIKKKLIPIESLTSSILKKPALSINRQVGQSTPYHRCIKLMKLILKNIPNVAGISAPQLGFPYRIFAFKNYASNKIHICVNPRWSNISGITFIQREGCLSEPGVIRFVSRFRYISLRSLDQNLIPRRVRLYGTSSAVVQHEYDHLFGNPWSKRGGRLMK